MHILIFIINRKRKPMHSSGNTFLIRKVDKNWVISRRKDGTDVTDGIDENDGKEEIDGINGVIYRFVPLFHWCHV